MNRPINWAKIAEPSEYSDTIVARFAEGRWPYRKHERMVVERMQRTFEHNPKLVAVDPTDLRVQQTLDWLACWSAGDRTVRSMADVWWPMDMLGCTENGVGGCCGSDTPSLEQPRAIVYSTIFDRVAGAEGLLHEVGHLRLKALGIDFEEHNGLILENDSAELYVSPIRKDKLRPMSAVVHAQYSYVLVIAFDVEVYKANVEQGVKHIDFNLFRIREGHQTLQDSARWTSDIGVQFWEGLSEYTERVIARAERALAEAGVKEGTWR